MGRGVHTVRQGVSFHFAVFFTVSLPDGGGYIKESWEGTDYLGNVPMDPVGSMDSHDPRTPV